MSNRIYYTIFVNWVTATKSVWHLYPRTPVKHPTLRQNRLCWERGPFAIYHSMEAAHAAMGELAKAQEGRTICLARKYKITRLLK